MKSFSIRDTRFSTEETKQIESYLHLAQYEASKCRYGQVYIYIYSFYNPYTSIETLIPSVFNAFYV
jgi:hypothetical protein